MNGAVVAIRECGSMSFLMLFVAAAGIAVAIVALAYKQPGLASLALVLGLATIGLGFFGEHRDRQQMADALRGAPSIDPSWRERIAVQGAREAHRCVDVGYGAGLAILGLSFIARVALAVRRPRA